MDHATKTQISNQVRQYKELQNLFLIFCEDLLNILPEGNEYHIELLGGDHVSRQLKVLGHPCSIDFGIHLVNGDLRGKITFQSKFSAEIRQTILILFFDALGNIYARPEGTSASGSMKFFDVTNWMLPSVMRNFLYVLGKQE